MAISPSPQVSPELIAQLRSLCGDDAVIVDGDKVERLSKDFYWYSPVLRRQLEEKRADVAVRPPDLATLENVVASCCQAGVPVTVRGAGTGNYGQCIPLHGGVVLDLSALDRIHSVDGVAHVEPGARLGAIETKAREVGWELRCFPSTFVKASMGGFFCGGSGGIGSITWGGINCGDNVKSVTLLTVEEEPRRIRFEEGEALTALHTYGTTGIMIEIEMRLAPKRLYRQLAFSHADWSTLIDWTDEIARDTAIPKRLVTQFEDPIPEYFKPLKRYFRAGEHVTFLLIDEDHADNVKASAGKAGLACVYEKSLGDPMKPPYLTDYTWNHTTLWAIKADDSFTYLQAGFAANFREQIQMLWEKFPGEIVMHLEWVTGNAKMQKDSARMGSEGEVVVGSIPLVRFTSEERLQEIIDYCGAIGVGIANPHTFFLEEGGRHPNIEEKRALKQRADPHGLLNPGKMKTFAHNPFAGVA